MYGRFWVGFADVWHSRLRATNKCAKHQSATATNQPTDRPTNLPTAQHQRWAFGMCVARSFVCSAMSGWQNVRHALMLVLSLSLSLTHSGKYVRPNRISHHHNPLLPMGRATTCVQHTHTPQRRRKRAGASRYEKCPAFVCLPTSGRVRRATGLCVAKRSDDVPENMRSHSVR